ncbi:restriction endonuclease subunit S [Vibrio parahaemolyticus]|uniref:restriction endonuclease subunit S n=1 Tax=Vibrio parahaemolyticus TaxID=670 RepID=UPI001655DF01|nr:restriction endonuclease subunit S [Vibrio parahaemolyticus]MBC8656171.1 restriction endonuclease subunit S [Vibrio parahaemolyticus]
MIDKSGTRESWLEVLLEDCVSILDAKRVPINTAERTKRVEGKSRHELYPYYGATGEAGLIDDFIFEGEHLLIGEDGAPFFDKTKNVAFIVKDKFWVNNHAHILKAFDSVTSNKYLCHYLNQFNYQGFVGGSTRLKLNQASLKKIPILLPPLSTQKAIIEKIEELFSHIDAGVEGLKQAKAKLQQYRQSVLKDAVKGKLTEQWRAQNADKLEPAEHMLERILDERRANWEAEQLKAFEEKGKTPKNDKWKDKYKEPVSPNDDVETDFPTSWQVVSPDMIFASVTDGDHQAPPKVSDGIPFLVIGDVNTGEIKFGDKRFVPQEYYDAIKDERKPEKGDLLYTVVGSYGIPVKVETETPFCVQRHIAILKPSLEIIRDFYFHVFNSGFVYSQATAVATGTAQKTVSLGGLRSFKLPLPPKIEQEKIAELVEEKLNMAYKTEATVGAKIEHASFLKSSILARAFSGELVSNASNESAGELLDKIKLEKDSIVKTKQKRSTKRKKKVTPGRKPLLTVLNEQSEPLKPDELMQLAGFLSNEVEEFYIELAEIAEQVEQLSPDTEQIKNWPYEKESEITLKLKG